MSRLKAFAVASCLGLLATAFVPARADEWNKKTVLTVNEPVALPTTVLQPGKYVMKLMESQQNRHIVQVFDEGEQKLITTILAIPNQRLEPADDTSFSYWETTGDQPRALRSWFYPGDNFGHEFAYPKDAAMRLAQATNQNVPAIMTDNPNDVASAEVRTMTPSGQPQDMSAESGDTQAQSSSTTAVVTPPAGTASSETAQTQTSTETDTSSSMAAQTQPSDQSSSASAQTTAPDASASASGDTNASQRDTSASAQTDMSASSQTDASASASTSSAQAGVSADAGDASLSARAELPQTASPLPLMGLAGLGAAAAALAARVASKR